jgi:hypothetical protein
MNKFMEAKVKQINRVNKAIWKSLGIERAIKKYGFIQVKSAINTWSRYQTENAKLLREKRELEQKLSEIDKKL